LSATAARLVAEGRMPSLERFAEVTLAKAREAAAALEELRRRHPQE
jgi:hypothetical protein